MTTLEKFINLLDKELKKGLEKESEERVKKVLDYILKSIKGKIPGYDSYEYERGRWSAIVEKNFLEYYTDNRDYPIEEPCHYYKNDDGVLEEDIPDKSEIIAFWKEFFEDLSKGDIVKIILTDIREDYHGEVDNTVFLDADDVKLLKKLLEETNLDLEAD